MPKNTLAKTAMNSVYVPAYQIWDLVNPVKRLINSHDVHTGIKYRMTFFKLSNTRRPFSMATGMEDRSLLNKIMAA